MTKKRTRILAAAYAVLAAVEACVARGLAHDGVWKACAGVCAFCLFMACAYGRMAASMEDDK